MARAAKAFLGLWLPAMAVLLAGLWRAWQTGQADPWDWSIAVAGLMALIGFLLANRTIVMLIWIALGVVAPVLIFCAVASGQLRLFPTLGLTVTALLTLVAAAWLRHPPILRGRMAAMGMIVAAGAILYFGPPPSLAAADTRPKLAVLTGLPLFWDEMGPAGTGPRDAPIITVLRTRFTVLPLDDPRDLPGTGARRLLIAQPRALDQRAQHHAHRHLVLQQRRQRLIQHGYFFRNPVEVFIVRIPATVTNFNKPYISFNETAGQQATLPKLILPVLIANFLIFLRNIKCQYRNFCIG